MDKIKPLNITVSRGVLNGQMYDILDQDEFAKKPVYVENTGMLRTYNGQQIILPIREGYTDSTVVPGVYNEGCINFVVYPEDDMVKDYIPEKIVRMDNKMELKDVLEKREIIARLDEPWITSPDSITQFVISDEDKPEMVCLKSALNAKKVDIDKYSARFGQNFPNDKRQLKNNSATLNIIKRFCKNMDMECLITLRDKNPDVPNPMSEEITFSLTESYSGDDDDDE